ncbi:MAG TPA: hypothetical protein VGW77_15400 [Candidatus Binatia bacterium]|jgi:chromosome segregation ATPase|nr:hypothetical protein [Candidatus Binatia bacterium]
MENLYSWLIIFSGATITLLGSFLFISERELRNKRREFDEFKRRQTAAPQQSETHSSKNKELLEEVAALSSKLAAGEKSVEELRAIQENARLENQQWVATNQQLQREIADFHEQLATAQSQLGESARHHREATVCNEKLQSEAGELKQQLEQRQAAIEELQKAATRLSEVQPELQTVHLENQRLQDELEDQRAQLHSAETRLHESTRKNQQVSDRCAHLAAEAADFKQQLEDSQSKVRKIDAAQQRLANVESRETIYREQQEKLEALVVDLERELSEGKNQVQALDETHRRLRETERVCKGLAEENRRLGEEVSVWQGRLAASEENQRQVSLLRQQLDELRNEHARVLDGNRRAQEKLAASEPLEASCLMSGSDHTSVVQSPANNNAELSSDLDMWSAASVDDPMPSEIAIAETRLLNNGSNETRSDQPHLGSGDSTAGIEAAKEGEASSVVWTSVKRKWRFAAVPAIVVVVIAGAVAMKLATSFSTSEKSAGATETSSDEYTAEVVSRPQIKSAPRVRGTFETVRPTQVYTGPSENSALIGNIGPGMKLNVVDSSDGWLEVRSKHGRPPGFIRQEAAVRIGQN